MNPQTYTGTVYAQRDTSLPTLSGTASDEKGKTGAVARISVGGEYYEVPVDPLTGKYTWTANTPLPDGDYSVWVTIKDRAGNVGKPSLYTLRVDTTPPAAPELINLYDNIGTSTSSFDAGKITDDKRPTLTGLAQKGSTVYLRDVDGNTIGSAKADSTTGKWVIDPTIDLKDGANSLTLVAEEKFANKMREGSPSAPFIIVVGADGTVLQQPRLNSDDVTPSSHDMNLQAYNGTVYAQRNTSLPSISGGAAGEKGKTGAIAQISVGGQYFEVPVDSVTGRYTWTSKVPMPDGDYSVSVTIKDRAGNIGKPTLLTLRVDTTPPNAPELLNLYDNHGAKTGSFDAGQIIDDKRPKLTGIAQEGTTVYLRDAQGNTLGSALADKTSGKWVIEPSVDLDDGVNNLTLVAEETFANVKRSSTASAPFAIVVEAGSTELPPNTITIKKAVDDTGVDPLNLASGSLTEDTTPTLSGEVSDDMIVTIYYRLTSSDTWTGSAIATTNGTHWSWTPNTPFAAGEYEFQASIGGYSSSLFRLEIATAEDIQKKTRIEFVFDDFGAWQGPLSSGAITDGATPTFNGRGTSNSKIVLRYTQSGQPSGTVVVDVDSSGNWTWKPASSLSAGNWNFDVQPQEARDWSEAFSLIITGAEGYEPVITEALPDAGSTEVLRSNDTTDDATPHLYGRAEANSVIFFRTNSGTTSMVYSVITDSAGNWSWTPEAELATGSWHFRTSKSTLGGWSDAFTLHIGAVSDANGLEEFSYSFTEFVEGLSYTLDSGASLVMHEQGVVNAQNNASGFYAERVLVVNLESKVTLALPSPTSKFEFSVLQNDVVSTAQIAFYSAEKSLVGSLTVSSNQLSIPGYYTFDYLSENVDISYIEITTVSGAEIAFDWIKWGASESATNNDTMLSEQFIFDLLVDDIEPLSIELNTLLKNGEKNLFIEDDRIQLMVNGSDANEVQLKALLPQQSDITEWKHQNGSVTIAGVEYNVYRHGDDAELLVQQGVKTELV
ncbi:Ig-like domain-containing protein [Pantoea sp. CTOTU49201]|uniref:Ig-like domain-containing protein n=1 Tax=Pantoea sp. CTOTU49201 TaxID=2953855 RepID=UPI00289CE718|nr:Ig-like domain-containing protein [Pantoea sp. CTOTU49201]